MCYGHKISHINANVFLIYLSRRLWTGRIYLQMAAVNWCWCNACLEYCACADVPDVSLSQVLLRDYIIKSDVHVNGSGKKMWQPCLNVSFFLKSGTEIKTVGDHKNKRGTGRNKASWKAKRDENNYVYIICTLPLSNWTNQDNETRQKTGTRP